MHQQLESYLEQVKRQLKSLPPEQQAEELQEIRQHLQCLIASNTERGDSEDKAVVSAIHQFGNSKLVGRALKQAWDRRALLSGAQEKENAMYRRLALTLVTFNLFQLLLVLFVFTPWLIRFLRDFKVELPLALFWMIEASLFARSPLGILLLLGFAGFVSTRALSKRAQRV